uniref:F-box domain-containing protein n=1 Tax=Leersia perrieri TaxID=77586 RepID=A0A0D9VM29_9ORYZ
MNRKGNPHDRLSKLPDDLLLNILDRLHVRDAARTSLLSRRWRNLPSMLSQLNIEFVHFMRDSASKLTADVLVQTNASVVEATKSILERRNPGNLRFDASDIPNVLMTCKNLQYLRLFNFDSAIPSVLQLEHPQLNVLNIAKCRFESIKLKFLPKLTQFVIEDWISFQDPLSFGYVPSLEAMRLTNVGLKWHKLVKLCEILGNTSVRDLGLDFRSEKIWVQPELPQRLESAFYKLRLVNLFRVPEGCDLTWTLFILKAAPFLKELRMTVWDHWCDMEKDEERRASLYSSKRSIEWESSAQDFKHHNLAVLTIFCFQSEDYLVAFIKRIMEVAVNLEDVFLYNMMACDMCLYNPSKFPRTKRQRCSVKNRINQGGSFAIFQFFPTLKDDHFPISRYP